MLPMIGNGTYHGLWINNVTDAFGYYRIVVTGEKLLAAIKQDTVGPFHFDEEYKLTEEEVSKLPVFQLDYKMAMAKHPKRT